MNGPPPVTVPPGLAEAVSLLIDRGLRDLGHRGGLVPAIAGLADFRSRLRSVASARPPAIMPRRTAEPRTLTTFQAAEVMNLSPQRVRDLARSGRIIARKRGRDWWIDADAAADYHRRRA